MHQNGALVCYKAPVPNINQSLSVASRLARVVLIVTASFSIQGEHHMRKTLVALSMAAAAAVPQAVSAQTAAPAAAPSSNHTFTGNVGLFSEYRFSGISQTFAKPAFQGGFDYSHASGIYLGN